MSYIDELAGAIRDSVAPHLLPDGDTTLLFRIYRALALAEGEQVVLEDVHDAWAEWMSGQDPSHPSLTPFSELSAETHRSDQPYLDPIRAVVRDRKARTLTERHRTSIGLSRHSDNKTGVLLRTTNGAKNGPAGPMGARLDYPPGRPA